MENILNIPATFSIEVGKNYISFDELQNLEIDQCFIVNKNAGEPLFLKVNNEIICSGDVVIINNYFGFRIVSIYNRSQSNELTSHIDTLEELIPIEVRFHEFQSTIEDLKGISEGTIIPLDKPYNENIDVTLLALGMPVAEGKTIVVKENFGIHIKKCLVAAQDSKKPGVIRNSGNRYIYQSNKNVIKHYDYSRPDRFTWSFIKKIELLHRSFVNNLSQNTGYNFEQIDVTADQMTLSEFISTIKEDIYTYHIYDQIFPKITNPDNKTKEYKMFFESKYIKNKLPDDIKERIKSFMDRRISEPKMLICMNRNLKMNKTENEIDKIFLNTLQNTWLQITNTSLSSDKISHSKNEIAIVSPNDMILLVAINDKNGQLMVMIYPLITIEPVIPILK